MTPDPFFGAVMPSIQSFALTLLSLCGLFGATATAQEKINPKTQKIIESLEKVLPEYAKTADALENMANELENGAH